MVHESYWHRRLTEVTLKASVAPDQRVRDVYMELAAHYASMDQLCSQRAPARPQELKLLRAVPIRTKKGLR